MRDWVQIVPNTDIALFLGMAHHVLEQGLEDRAYIEKYTTGADRWIVGVKGEDDGTAKTPDWAAGITGIPADKIREMAELFAKSRTQFGGAWSLQRAHHGELTHHAIINFAALIGKIGKPGEGVGFSWHHGSGGMPQSASPRPRGCRRARTSWTSSAPPAHRRDAGKSRQGVLLQRPDPHLSRHPDDLQRRQQFLSRTSRT